MLVALLFMSVLAPPAAAPAAAPMPGATQTPAAAMDYLVRTLPNVKTFDAWQNGWREAPLDRAKFKDMCELRTGAPFVKVYSDFGDHHDAPARQNFVLDFSGVSAIGQNGTRVGYKVAGEPNIIMGFTARDEETARGIAVALDTMRKACTA
jgi:hypothetical protein